MQPTRLIVFDCDGTLVDSQHVICAAMAEAFGSAGLPAPPLGAVRRVIGLSLAEAIGRLLPEASNGDLGLLVEAYKEAFVDLRSDPAQTDPLFEGARDALDSLTGQGYLLGLATGKSRRGVRTVFERHDLSPYFVTVQTADDAPGKPHPAMLEQAMTEVGAAPAETVMIGDTTFDMEMARNAGATPIGVTWGYHESEELNALGAHSLIDHFAELEMAIANLFAAAAPQPAAIRPE